EGTCITTTTTTTVAPTTTTSTTLCPNHVFTFNVGAHDDTSLLDDFDFSDEWLGGSETQSVNANCTVKMNKPSGNEDLVGGGGGDSWAIVNFTGFTNCFGFGGEDGDGCNTPSCDAPAAIGFCQSARPSCSSALGGGGASASFNVQCLQ